MFPRNAWYVAAQAEEVGAAPLGRRICGEALVLFRGPGGVVAAVEDFCPHRGAPLSLGRVVEGTLQCGYHGLRMGCDGHTVAMPGQRVGSFRPVRAYPAVERHGFVWVWPGEAGAADAARIPPFPWSSDPAWAFGGGLYHVRCDYRLMIDNLMDLTHETYVHADTIGQREIEEAPPETVIEGEEVVTRRFMFDIPAPPFWKMALRGMGLPDDQPVDRWQICRFSPPSHVMIEVGVALAGRGGHEADPSVKASSVVVDFLTPETETTMWYFWGMARRFAPQDAALTDRIRDGQRKIFGEDLAMLEGQQRNLLAHPERRLLRLNIDAGGVHARRVVERLAAAEGRAGERASAAPPLG